MMVLIALFGLLTNVYSTTKPEARYLGIEHGLSNNFVTAIFQDRHGFMWFGTYDGLNRFDGYEFKVFKNQPDVPSSLPDNRITDIIEDHRGLIWTGTKKGAGAFDGTNGRFSRLQYFTGNGGELREVPSAVSQLACLPNGDLFAATEAVGLLIVPRNTNHPNQAVQIPYTYANGQRFDYNILAMATGYDATLWMVIQGVGLCYYDSENQTVKLKSRFLQSVSCIQPDTNGHIWLGNGNGLYRYRISDSNFQHYTTAAGLSGKVVASLSIDSNGKLWIGTDGGGITIIDIADGSFSYISSDVHGGALNSNAVFATYEDAERRQWIGTLRGGINIIDPNSGHFKLVRLSTGKPEYQQRDYILSFAEDRDGTVWIGTDGAGLMHWNRKAGDFTNYYHQIGNRRSLSNNYVTTILRDQYDDIWVATYGGGINKFDRSTGSFKRYGCFNPTTDYDNLNVWKLFEDSEGQLWATTLLDGGVYRLNRASDRFELYDATWKNVLSIVETEGGVFWLGTYTELIKVDIRYRTEARYPIGNSVRFIRQGRNDSLWVGTEGGGLLWVDGESGNFHRFTEATGMPSNAILNLLQDSQGNFWLSTYNGIAKFNPNTKSVKNFYESDGLQSNQFNYNAALKLRSGEFLFGGIKGFNVFFPDSVHLSYASPRIVLTDLRLNNLPFADSPSARGVGQSLLDIEKLVVPYDEAVLSFGFAALEYSSPNKIKYKYLLEGWDNDWNLVERQRTAHYSRLSEGQYILRIRATNADGEWLDTERRVNITVLPPWWRTFWAYTVYGLLLLVAVGTYILYDRRQTKLKYEVELAHMEVEKEKELNERKLTFFTHISHEFRTPLTLIVNPVKELLYSENKMVDSEELAVVYQNSKRLLSLVDQLLLFRKADSGADELRLVRLDIVALCHEVFLCFKQHAESRQLTYTFVCEATEVAVHADREKMEIVLFNLINNAIKFTQRGGSVTLALRPRADHVEIDVIDTGCGIAPGMGDTLFTKFYRDHRGNEKGTEGFGIGLFLVKKFMDAHSGTISYTSSQDLGTCFTVGLLRGKEHFGGQYVFEDISEHSVFLEEMLPDSNVHEAQGVRDNPQGIDQIEDIYADSPVMLVVDDNSQVRQYITQLFRGRFSVYQAASAEKGLALARIRQPDIIVSDVVMQGMSGIDLCTEIKQDPALGHIPIILLTASTSDEIKLKGIEGGADDYITKPFDKELLLARVTGMLKSRSQLQRYFYNEVTLQSNDFKISNEYSEFLNRCIIVVERHLDNPEFNIKMLADEVNMSHSNLYKKVKSISGKSTNEFIRFIRLRKVAQLLISTDYNIREAAFAGGFNDIKYFREQFFKLFGMRPSDYKKRYRRTLGNRLSTSKPRI